MIQCSKGAMFAAKMTNDVVYTFVHCELDFKSFSDLVLLWQVEVLQKMDDSYFGEGLTLIDKRYLWRKLIAYCFLLSGLKYG